MAQFESELIEENPDQRMWHDNQKWVDMVSGDGGTVAAMKWVAGRLTGMQSNVKEKQVVPASWLNHFIVLIIGIMKRFVFLLPLGQMKGIFKSQEQEKLQEAVLEYEVFKEKDKQVGEEWIRDICAPYAQVEVFRSNGTISLDEPPNGRGFLNLPIRTGSSTEPTNLLCPLVGLHGGGLCHDENSDPGIYFEVEWKADQTPMSQSRRCGGETQAGELTITAIEATGFPVLADVEGWRLRITVPQELFGEGARTSQLSQCSRISSQEPTWNECISFSINWCGGGKQSVSVKDDLAELLEEQIQTLKRLEAAALSRFGDPDNQEPN